MSFGKRCDFGFSDSPPETDAKHEYEIVRLGPGKKLKGIILSDHLFCRRIHYVRKQATPHFETGCEPCSNNISMRWYGWLAIYNPGTGNTIICEFPKKPVDKIANWQKERGSLRGVELLARRRGKEINGTVTVDLTRGTLEPALLPAEPDVQICLLRMWGLDRGLPGLGVAVARRHRFNGVGEHQ